LPVGGYAIALVTTATADIFGKDQITIAVELGYRLGE